MSKNPVLLCYDGSDDAKYALTRAADLFAGRTAVVLSVWEHGWAKVGLLWPDADTMQTLETAMEENAGKLAEEGVRIAEDGGLTAEPLTRLAPGPLWQQILAVAAERDAAAIVLGTRGLGGVRSMVLGSVSNAVVHHADRPVVIVRRGQTDATDAPSTPQ
jgi:nucleotide-binding universal stress UspA family protein